MKNIIKQIILILIVICSCSCVKDETVMTINSDKSVNLEINLGYSISSGKTIDIAKLKDIVSPLGYSVDSYHDDIFTGYKLSKNYDNINDICSKEDNNVNFADILDGSLNVQNLFKVKKGFFKNTYTANFKYDFSKYYDYKVKLYFFGEDSNELSSNLYNYINEFINNNNYKVQIIKNNVLSNIDNFNNMNNILNKQGQQFRGIPVVIIGKNIYFGNTEENKNSITADLKNIFENNSDYIDVVANDYDNTYELIYKVNLPNKVLNTNADIKENDDKTLIWNINYLNPKNIEFTFTIFNKSSIVIIIILILTITIILVVGYILFIKYSNDRSKFIQKNTNIDNILPKTDDSNQIMSVNDLLKK